MIKTFALAGAALWLLAYLGTAFVVWDFNPGQWSQDERIGALIIVCLTPIIAALLAMMPRRDT